MVILTVKKTIDFAVDKLWSMIVWDIEEHNRNYKLIFCDKQDILSNIDEIADMISIFGIENNLRNPNSILCNKDKLTNSIRRFINDPTFLNKRKQQNQDFKTKIANLFIKKDWNIREDLDLKDTFTKIFRWSESTSDEINFFGYIKYICELSWNRPDLTNTISSKVIDIIK